MKRELTIYKTGNLKRVGWNYQYIEVPQIKCFIGLHVKCQYGNGMFQHSCPFSSTWHRWMHCGKHSIRAV